MNDLKLQNQLIPRLEELIRSGSVQLARTLLRDHLKLAKGRSQISRDDILQFATFCRRVSMPQWGIRILRPIVRPSARRQGAVQKATAKEKIEYAACLIQYELSKEGLAILNELSADQSIQLPEIFFYQGFAHLSLVQYQSAADCFLKYLLSAEKQTYQSRLATINYCVATLLQHKADKELKLRLDRLLKNCLKRKETLLAANTLECLCQWYFLNQDLPNVVVHAQMGLELLQDKTGLDRYLLERHLWLSQLALEVSPEKEKRLFKLLEYSASSVDYEEGFRETLLLLLNLNPETKLFRELYFSSPNHHHQQLLRDMSNKFPRRNLKISKDEVSIWRGSKFSDERRVSVHSIANQLQGRLLQSLFYFLIKDSFQSRSVMAIFEELYPNEYYQPLSSPQKVQQIVKRLRSQLQVIAPWLYIRSHKNKYKLLQRKESKYCIYFQSDRKTEIEKNKEGYFLSKTASELLVILKNKNKERHKLINNANRNQSSSFQFKHVKKLLPKCSVRTLQRALSELVKNTDLKRTGTRKAAWYSLS